jgi:hypothetical protein
LANPFIIHHSSFIILLAFAHTWWRLKWSLPHALHLPETLSLSPQEYRRIKHYCYGSTYLAVVMGSLLKHRRTASERSLFDQLAALAAVFDALAENFEHEHIEQTPPHSPEHFGQTADQRGLALYLLQNLQRAVPESQTEAFQTYLQRVFKAETAGKYLSTQGGNTPGLKALTDLTAEKGGASVLLFRSLLNREIPAAEANAMFQLGCLIQLSDDLFDLWHDHQAGIVTDTTQHAVRGEIQVLAEKLEAQILITQTAFRQTPYPTPQIESALQVLHYLSSISRVCVQHYLRLQHQYGTLPLENRTLMVVDMAKWKNWLHTARYLFHRNG